MAEPEACDKYFHLLKGDAAKSQEGHLVTVAELGAEFVLSGLPTEEVVEIHQEALRRLAQESPQMTLQEALQLTSEPLMETLMAYRLVFREREEIEREAELAEVRYQAERERDRAEIAYHEEMEAKLLHAAEEWRVTFDSVTDMISIHDKDFRLVRVNKAYASALGLHPKEIVGKNCYELFHGKDAPPEDCPHRKVLETLKPTRVEYFEPHLGKRLEVSLSPVFNGKGELEGSVHVAREMK